jgi:hypothetical protein
MRFSAFWEEHQPSKEGRTSRTFLFKSAGEAVTVVVMLRKRKKERFRLLVTPTRILTRDFSVKKRKNS